MNNTRMWFRKASMLRCCCAAAMVALGTLFIGIGTASPDGQGFASPEQAAKALLSANESNDVAAILKILGPSAKDIVVTSDPVADARARETFVKNAKEKMRVVADPNAPGEKVIEVGANQWPCPIPLVLTAGKWYFDVSQGKEEILLRRIGNNELTAIEVCRGYVEAQNEYFEQDRTGKGVRQYAQKFISTAGQHDGLYWKSENPKDESPIAELIARAIAEGYTNKAEPYQGYHFKILKGQGPHVSGGAMNYVVNGAMTRGFALIAWPSDYKSTGVMTFLLDRSGIVYQKDLGEQTPQIAAATSAYDPDQTWTPVSGSGVPPTTTSRVIR
jgi:hypothetical protein